MKDIINPHFGSWFVMEWLREVLRLEEEGKVIVKKPMMNWIEIYVSATERRLINSVAANS